MPHLDKVPAELHTGQLRDRPASDNNLEQYLFP